MFLIWNNQMFCGLSLRYFDDTRLPDQIFLHKYIKNIFLSHFMEYVLINRVKVTRQPLLESKSPSGLSWSWIYRCGLCFSTSTSTMFLQRYNLLIIMVTYVLIRDSEKNVNSTKIFFCWDNMLHFFWFLNIEPF